MGAHSYRYLQMTDFALNLETPVPQRITQTSEIKAMNLRIFIKNHHKIPLHLLLLFTCCLKKG